MRARQLAAVAAAWVVALAAPVASIAQTDAAKTEDAKIERQAYFTAEADGAVPGIITNEFPPGIVCILIPQVCSSQTQPVTDPLGGAVEPALDPDVPDYQSPQPVEPGTLPVGMLGGKPRHTSYVKFGLPAIPSDSLIDRFDLVLSQESVSYALESPAFRQAVLAGLVTYQNRSPDEFTRFVGDVARQTTPLAESAATGIEACAVTTTWNDGPSQDAATQPERDCIFGANGVFDEEEGTWIFDLSLLAQAWLDGTTPNEGVYLGPLGADNLAFGDPDTSTNWQISLAGKDADGDAKPRIRYAFSEGFGDESFEDFGEITLDDGGTSGDSVVTPSDPFASQAFDDSALADSGDADTTAAEETASAPIRGTLVGQSRPRTPWWVWLVLPVALGLAYLYNESLARTPPAGRAGRGALTRLMASAPPPNS